MQNDDVMDSTILFQGVPFFIKFCSCKCFKYVFFLKKNFLVSCVFMSVFVFFLFLYHYYCDYGLKIFIDVFVGFNFLMAFEFLVTCIL